MKFDIEKGIESVRVVDGNRNYWFVRTYGGKTYGDFIQNNYVGIGFNDVPLKYIEDCRERNESAIKNLREYIESKYPYRDGATSKWINQLIAFHYTVKEGDIVVVPDKNSDKFTVGVVESDVYVVSDNRTFFHNEKHEQFPEKRRKIKWQSNVEGLDTKDFKGISSGRQALARVDHYGDIIEGFVSSVFIREDQMHLVLKINQHEDINAFDLSDMLSGITYFYNEFCLEYGIEPNRDLTIKIKLQSEGKARVKGAVWAGVFGVLLVTSLAKDASFKVSLLGQELELETGEGVGNVILDIVNAKHENRMEFLKYQDSIKNLEVNNLKSANNNVDDDLPEEREGDNTDN